MRPGLATGPHVKTDIASTSCVSLSHQSHGTHWCLKSSLPMPLLESGKAWESCSPRGTGDNMAAALGLGLRPGDLVLSFGTSGTAFTVSDSAANDATGTVAGFADATGRFLPLVCTMNATKVTDAFARLIGVDHETFDTLALKAPAGSEGLVLVPHLDGERTPNRPSATGCLSGLRTDAAPAHLARAAVEGVVCNLLAAADALGQQASDGRVLLVGGAPRSPAYRRVVADLTGRVVHVPSNADLVAAGAAVQAAAVYRDADSPRSPMPGTSAAATSSNLMTRSTGRRSVAPMPTPPPRHNDPPEPSHPRR